VWLVRLWRLRVAIPSIVRWAWCTEAVLCGIFAMMALLVIFKAVTAAFLPLCWGADAVRDSVLTFYYSSIVCVLF